MRYVVEKLVRPGKWDLQAVTESLTLALDIIRAEAQRNGGQLILRCVEEE